MIPGFGKQTILLGSAPHCDLVLQGPGVAPEHARVVHQGGGKLFFLDAGVGPTTCNGQPMAPGSQALFDFHTAFVCGSVTVPINHPAFALMLMARGGLSTPPGQLVVGRDPARASLVVHHPSVSSQHATVLLDRMQVIDNKSTSGTYVGPTQIPPGTPVSIDPHGMVAFGPIPIWVSLLIQIAQAFAAEPAPPMVSIGSAAGMPAVQSPFASSAAGVPGASSLVAGGGSGAGNSPGKKHKTVVGVLDWGSAERELKTIGRTPDNDIRLDHPQVSSHHAVLIKRGEQCFIEDRKSANGTYVRGQRIAPGAPVAVSNGEKVFIGPMPLILEISEAGGQVVIEDRGQWAGRPLFEIEAWHLTTQVPDRDNPGQLKTLLDDISFKALPGDMVALMGPSGAGKTTLLLTLNGYQPPTAGMVRINGEDLYAIYDNLRGSIGYVPQDDIVHPELTVFEAIKYSARFRLPPDYSEEEIDRLVMTTLAQLGLEQVANLEIGRPEKKILSGGQRKRVNIALELVTDPVILFLDEPTSGLAADDTTALITLLSDLAKNTGKTIVMTIHQPAKDEFEKFNLALILGYGGTMMFFGPTHPDAYRFFGGYLHKQGRSSDIDNPRDMFDVLRQREQPIFDQLRASDPNAPRWVARQQGAKLWAAEFVQSPTYQKMYSGPRAIGTDQGRHGVVERASATKGQLRLLLSRYFKVKRRDVIGTAIMLLQAPIIGVLLAAVFGGQKDSVAFWCLGALQELMKRQGGSQPMNVNDLLAAMQPTTDHTAAAFFMVVSAVWFGTSNAAREIVSERAIYLRERMVNLGLWNYVMSKFLLLSIFCIVQCTMLLVIVFFTLGFRGGLPAFCIELANLITVSLCAVALGLLLSTLVTSSEAAMALTPIALIPQVVLGGLIVPMTTNPYLKWFMTIIPARWGFQGVITQERLAIVDDPAWIMDLKQPNTTAPEYFVEGGKFACAKAQLASETFTGAWGFSNYDNFALSFAALGAMTLFALILLLTILKKRDPVLGVGNPMRVRIYQIFVRLFGNPKEVNAFAGELSLNGAGKFASINQAAIAYIATLGMTHIWLTGVLRHASLTAYPELGFEADDADVVKGRAGSPFAIKDYYDLDPDLADNPTCRLDEFTSLVDRIHAAGLQVLIDFVPNHVARGYQSSVYPERDFGLSDNKSVFFSAQNDFFYLNNPPGQHLRIQAPAGWDPGGLDQLFPPEDGSASHVSRATGNNQVQTQLGPFDWYDTVKLNYGYNFAHTSACLAEYEPRPPVWAKMDSILAYWQSKGVDGFRCDFAHWVPIEFWLYVIDEARKRRSNTFFLAEAYSDDNGNPLPGSPPRTTQQTLLCEAGFDSVYDGRTFGISRQIASGIKWANDFDSVRPVNTYVDRYCRYAENHDERRAASKVVSGAGPSDTGYGSPESALAATAALVLSSGGPILLYAGQELGELGAGVEGYGRDDGKTSIFDYWSPPSLNELHQTQYEPSRLTDKIAILIRSYRDLMHLANEPAMRAEGGYQGLNHVNRSDPSFGDYGRWVYAFLRFVAGTQVVLVTINLHPEKSYSMRIRIPGSLLESSGFIPPPPLLSRHSLKEPCSVDNPLGIQEITSLGFPVTLQANEFAAWELRVPDLERVRQHCALSACRRAARPGTRPPRNTALPVLLRRTRAWQLARRAAHSAAQCCRTRSYSSWCSTVMLPRAS